MVRLAAENGIGNQANSLVCDQVPGKGVTPEENRGRSHSIEQTAHATKRVPSEGGFNKEPI